MTVSVELPANVEEKIKEMATKADVSLSKMIALILEAFTDGGEIFLGKWGKGERVVVSWPEVSHRIFKVPLEEMEGRK